MTTNLDGMTIHWSTSSTRCGIISGCHRCCCRWRWWRWRWVSPTKHPHDCLLYPVICPCWCNHFDTAASHCSSLSPLLNYCLQWGAIRVDSTVGTTTTTAAEFSPIKGHFDSILMKRELGFNSRNNSSPLAVILLHFSWRLASTGQKYSVGLNRRQKDR